MWRAGLLVYLLSLASTQAIQGTGAAPDRAVAYGSVGDRTCGTRSLPFDSSVLSSGRAECLNPRPSFSSPADLSNAAASTPRLEGYVLLADSERSARTVLLHAHFGRAPPSQILN